MKIDGWARTRVRRVAAAFYGADFYLWLTTARRRFADGAVAAARADSAPAPSRSGQERL
jgi:hypothetical protein